MRVGKRPRLAVVPTVGHCAEPLLVIVRPWRVAAGMSRSALGGFCRDLRAASVIRPDYRSLLGRLGLRHAPATCGGGAGSLRVGLTETTLWLGYLAC